MTTKNEQGPGGLWYEGDTHARGKALLLHDDVPQRVTQSVTLFEEFERGGGFRRARQLSFRCLRVSFGPSH